MVRARRTVDDRGVSDVEFAEISNRAIRTLSGIVFGPAQLIATVLRPTPEDYAAVFTPEAATMATNFYAPFWADPPASLTRTVNAQVRLYACKSQDIVASHEFPGGYAKIAHLLQPDHVWLRFRLVGDGSAIAYDGLVARGDRWAWFPKPWRMLDVGN